MNGFELFRQLVRKLDPPKVDVAFDMKAEIEGFGKHVCSNFGQTARFFAILDTRVRDYALETGLAFPLESLASVMQRAADTDTAGRLDEAGVGLSDFAKVAEWIHKRESKLRARGGAGSGKGVDAMVYGVSSPEAPAQPPSFAPTAPESPPLDPWAGAAADPWAAAAPQPQAPAAAQPELDAWALDAFGKGKGKGEPRAPLQCYNCLREGHSQFLCPSGKGAEKAGQGPACGNCKGKGH